MIYGSSDDQANAVQGPAGAGFFKGPITFWARKQILTLWNGSTCTQFLAQKPVS